MITVIVPIYKAEKFIHRCIESILVQSYADFELLLIDDGSPDNCGSICDEYALRDGRVRVFHKENGGVSSARNLGLDNARGEWVTFVDADDWIEENYLACLIQTADVDLIIGGIKVFSQSGLMAFDDNLYHSDSLLDFIVTNKGYGINTPCGNLMRTDIIKVHKIRFDERIRFTEDTVFNLQYLYYCNSIRTVSNCGYNYWDYDISNDACKKYHLSIDEISYTLSRLIYLNNRLGSVLKGTISSDADCASMLGMVPLEDKLDKQKGLKYYEMCKELSIVKDWNDFYNHELFSPIFQGISHLKYLYHNKSYDRGKELFNRICLYINNSTFPMAIKSNIDIKLRFRCKDFYLWYFLIKNNMYGTLDLFMKLYINIKNVFKK